MTTAMSGRAERSRSQTSRPDNPGSMRSRTTRSGRVRAATERAVGPSAARSTANPARTREVCTTSATVGSSSTTSTRAVMVVSVGRGAAGPASRRRPFDVRSTSVTPAPHRAGRLRGGARPGDPTIAGVAGGRRAAVLGSPIAHSLSPALHRAAHAALGLTGWSYERIECREEELAPLVAGLGPAWVGLSLTMPLKRVALDVADDVSPLAAAVGAADTLLLDGARRAHNTDVAGIVGAPPYAGVSRANTAVVLGAGGTAQAALAALRYL